MQTPSRRRRWPERSGGIERVAVGHREELWGERVEDLVADAATLESAVREHDAWLTQTAGERERLEAVELLLVRQAGRPDVSRERE